MMLPASGGSTIARLRNVGRTFGTDPAVHALVDVSLDIAAGAWLSIVGPSGSGKSTLLNIMGLLDRPTSGSYTLDDVDVSRLTGSERAAKRAADIGFVFQAFHLLPYRTAVENVMLADLYSGGSRHDRRARAAAALESVGLADRLEHVPSKLSGGEMQRVAIARAVYTNPRLLLCDEPTGNLDRVSGEVVLEVIGSMHDTGLTIVMITHDDEVAAHAQRRLRIVDGRLGGPP